MKYRLFVSDFDGTLGKAPDVIEPETVEAVKEYQKLLKNKKDPSEEDRRLMQTYGKKADFFDPSAAQPVIDAAKA